MPKLAREVELEAVLADARDEIAALEGDIADLKETLEQERAERKDIASDAVHGVLDFVERPVGTLHCTIPPSPSASRAILALFDAVDRRL